ncbi:T9SS type A sorting domain-containing protein [Flavobacterium restrictum]|uniref:T9SS type A sorting domain-containing protein n=1 Tax=Flavobacterium restrictum TaxID=2594428 RepID=A0A553DYA1_9FLAO|nr:T9SS type A sorting domain-containing protein [Flavobacterium restrictum]TRX37784.1 T9SS type A sorting domain-containing protein [Flavobacterium restrictum]
MKKSLHERKGLLFAVSILFFGFTAGVHAQDYSWTGAADTDFYNTANWTNSTSAPIVFDNAGWKVARTHALGNSAVISKFVDWQPGIFDSTDGNLTVNADFNIFYNDKLNGTITVNTGATFTCRHIFRLGSEGTGILNVNGGTFRSNDPVNNPQLVLIGVLSGGNGIATINDGGTISGGYQLEIGTRDYYPTGLLNVNTGGTADAYWATVVGPNGTVNIDGGNLNTGQALIVGDLYVDNAGTEGTTGTIVGKLNINSGTVMVNQNDLDSPALNLNAKAKVVIDNGSLIIKRSGTDFTSIVNGYVTAGQIVPAAGKEIVVAYDGVLTTVTAKKSLGINDFDVSNRFAIYPNPVQESINIMAKGNFNGDLKVSVVTITGQTVIKSQTIKANAGSYTVVSKNKLASGMYLVQINTGTTTVSKKIMVK